MTSKLQYRRLQNKMADKRGSDLYVAFIMTLLCCIVLWVRYEAHIDILA